MSRRDLVLGPNNARVRALRRLATQRRDRRVEGVALVEGPTLVAEALSDDRIIGRVREVFTESPLERSAQARADDASIPVTFVEAGVLDKVLDTVTPQPIVAVVETLSASIELLATDRPVLVLVDVRDPGNLGTLIRTAEASGCAGVVLAGTCVDPTNPKVVRASAGSWLRTIVVEDRDIGAVIDGLADQRRPIVAAALVDGAARLVADRPHSSRHSARQRGPWSAGRRHRSSGYVGGDPFRRPDRVVERGCGGCPAGVRGTPPKADGVIPPKADGVIPPKADGVIPPKADGVIPPKADGVSADTRWTVLVKDDKVR
ncbi:MAG: RNA methyltransferase [Acidimicrobiales bacterium]